jgi:hypothetical protein
MPVTTEEQRNQQNRERNEESLLNAVKVLIKAGIDITPQYQYRNTYAEIEIDGKCVFVWTLDQPPHRRNEMIQTLGAILLSRLIQYQ